MDLNVCSRRVHDGYATIRSRGRSRPRAVYRSDSEELLKDADGPYSLPRVSNIPIVPDQIQSVPRWSDVGRDKLLENYGTLRKTPKKEVEPRQEVITLNTFASKNWPKQDRLIPNGESIKDLDPVSSDDRLYDTVPLEETLLTLNTFLSKKIAEPLPDHQERHNGNLYEPTDAFRVVEQRCRIISTAEDDRFAESRGGTDSKSCEIVDNKRESNSGRQPIYAIPNVATLKSDQRSSVDGNYVPSGDLYRTTAKYIEDINRNIAEIDKSYEELRSNSNNSAYGVINKIAKRKRDMAPMLPITSHFADDDRTSLISVDHLPRIFKSRPNSYGKLPPKVLPRSSSIDSSCRHSTGSTSTTTESTDSLYAISESLTELTIHKVLDKRDQRRIYEKTTKEASSSDEEQINRPLLTGTIRRNRSRVEAADFRKAYRKNNIQLFRRASERIFDSSRRREENRSDDRRYGTLPCRRSKTVRPLHKSSEDVLEGERVPDSLQRTCMSTIDVSRNDEAIFNNPDVCLPLYLMDATEIIRKGQLQRAQSRQENLLPQEQVKRADTLFSGTLGGKNSRTRHNSLESEEDAASECQGFATLPRRANVSKDRSLNDAPRRLSGNVPILEPLYEHAVSHSVRPRNPQSVIPWYELATRKYRHRSCPSLQAHVVSAFEQSLSNMTQRLQQLTATAEKKDTELQELRDTIERLRKQSAEATLNNNIRRHTLGDSDSGTTGCTGNSNHQGSSIARQLSADSVTSLNSLSSACSISSHHKKKGWLRSSFSKAFSSRTRKHRQGSISDAEDCKEGVGDLSVPNSPRLPIAAKHERGVGQDQNQTPKTNGQKSPESDNAIPGSKSSSALYKQEDEDDDDVDELKKQLREKDMVLTDIRLEALSSAHQLESLKDTVIKMRNEMLNLKQNNERLQRLVTSKSLTSSQSSLPSDPERRFSMTEVASTVAALSNGDHGSTSNQLEDLNIPEQPVVPSATSTSTEPAIEQDTDGKRINVVVYLGSEKSFNFNLGNSTEGGASDPPHCIIASVCISNKTTWDSLDTTVRRCFKDYVTRVDPVTNLGLGVECIAAYHLGEASRCITESQHPELLPCGYMVGHVKSIYLVLSGYSWLAVDTLIPRSIVQRQVNHLMEHRRVILCGPSGTGKSYLAGKLAHALVDADTENKDAAAVATYNVDHKSSKELRQYLTHIAERCDSNAADELPRVIILENLQHAASLSELFSGLLGTRHSTCPAIIGTMSQATCSTTNLQLHHNFRWVLCANHMEPVKGFLGRYLRRKLLEHELRETGGSRNAEMAAVVEWLPRVWLHLNKFLETHSSSDVTIGPRLFLSCPMEVSGSQVWFTDLWNYSVIPYLVEAVREGLALYGRRTSGGGNGDSVWEDPAQFIITSYPWISTHAVHGGSDALLRLRPEDVGYDVVTSGHSSGVGASSVKSLGSTHSDTDGDPLLNMLLRLQEAANFSSPLSNDSDSNSLDSSHTRHSEDLSSSTSSSRGVESAL